MISHLFNPRLSFLAIFIVVLFSPKISHAMCGEPATLISDIQGTSAKSSLVNETHTIEAVVIASFQAQDALKGFFLQEETIHQDSNPKSSEGIFVYHQDTPVEAGQVIRLSGEVQEKFGQTQLAKITDITVCDNNALRKTTTEVIRLPNASTKALEAYEGMLVKLRGKNIVTDNYNLGRYGEFTVSNKARLSTPTQFTEPGIAANDLQKSNNLNRLVIDDVNNTQNAEPIAYPNPELTSYNSLRTGQRVRNITGVLTYAFGKYRIQPTKRLRFNKSPRPESPQDDDDLLIASFNVQNYFNGDGLGGDFPTARGADSFSEFQRQSTKLGHAIASLGAAIVGIAELENDGYEEESAIASLTTEVNSLSHEQYKFINVGLEKLGDDAIAVGILYVPEMVTPIGDPITLSTPPFDTLSRQPLAQNFIFNETETTVLVVVNHFKSKSCRGAKGEDKNQKDGQGCYNATRIESANQIISWIDRIATTPHVIILGDLNSYAHEDPVKQFVNAGYRNKLHRKKDYTYSFRGQAGVLDYVLFSRSLDKYIKSVDVWHINADEPRVLDYNEEFKSASQLTTLYSSNPFRSSDHDPAYAVIDFDEQDDD